VAEPYVLDVPTVVGNVAQTFANLVALRLDILNNPRPSYNLHGESMDWPKLYAFLNTAIADLQKQLSQLEPWEAISIAR
jgi:hypothetical protein